MSPQNPNPFADQPQINPYVPPQYPAQPQIPVGGSDFAGLWRQGNMLIMHKDAPLPFICVKSNQPANQWLKRKLQWYPMWAFFVGGAILAMAMSKKATIQIALTDEWAARRKQRLMIAIGCGLGGLLMGFLGILIASMTNPQPGDFGMVAFFILFFGGIILALGSLIVGNTACKLINATKMTNTHIWISGVHPDFLNRLQTWV